MMFYFYRTPFGWLYPFGYYGTTFLFLEDQTLSAFDSVLFLRDLLPGADLFSGLIKEFSAVCSDIGDCRMMGYWDSRLL